MLITVLMAESKMVDSRCCSVLIRLHFGDVSDLKWWILDLFSVVIRLHFGDVSEPIRKWGHKSNYETMKTHAVCSNTRSQPEWIVISRFFTQLKDDVPCNKRHTWVKCPVSVEKVPFLKLYFLTSSYHASIAFRRSFSPDAIFARFSPSLLPTSWVSRCSRASLSAHFCASAVSFLSSLMGEAWCMVRYRFVNISASFCAATSEAVKENVRT